MTAEFERHPFLLSVQEVVDFLGTDTDKGLSTEQLQQLRQTYPPNELDVGGAVSWYTILIRQLCNAMIFVLIFAMALSFGVTDWVEGGILAAVIVINVSIGFWQELGNEKKMEALKALSSPTARVLRNGENATIPNAEVVPGDIISLKMGDTVPADLRIFEAMNLACDESQLTGEAIPVDKSTANDILAPGTEKLATSEGEVGIGDRINIAYATTTVTKGRGRGIVIATGMQTEVGKIAKKDDGRKPGRSMNVKKYGPKMATVGAAKRAWDFVGKFLGLTEGTPLQIKLSMLAYGLFLCALILALVVFGVNGFKAPTEVVIYAVSTGIAIIPESLVAVLTLTMVTATAVMRKANVVVRDLSALEALGGVTNICSDKTGTLTQGAMILKKLWLPSKKVYTVSGSMDPNDPTAGTVTVTQPGAGPGEEAPRDFDQERTTQAIKFDVPDNAQPSQQNEQKTPEEQAEVTPELRLFLLSAALCNLATVRYDEAKQKWQTTGEPTEIALQVFAKRFELGKKALEALGWKQTAEFPFDSSIKRMSVVYDAPANDESGLSPENSVVFTKGAVERILDLCSHVGAGEAQQPISDALKEQVLAQMNDFASQGQRVLAIAYRPWVGRFNADQSKSDNDEQLRASVERDLVLLGLVGIYDPPRDETSGAIRECSGAGIKVHMLTGDHHETAKAIAREVGIIPTNMGQLPAAVADKCVMKATDFDKMTDDEIDAMEELPLVIARCAPSTKTRMIEALRRRNGFMAMTGDGVNDAPSLSSADVGIAMGSGSDVAKGAAKIVLTDDKFNSIVAAIREGRRMFANIQKFVLHLLSSNVGEVILLIAGLGFRDASGFSVFPIAPLQILSINMLTSSGPAFGLGREKASPEVMLKPPHDKKRGVFTNQILVDMVVYGILMGTTTLMTFVIVVYGANNGQLGENCNTTFSESCGPVFRARAAIFIELTWMILISAWEFKSIRRSMFKLDPRDTRRFPFFKDMYNNKVLFWTVVIGALSVFPFVYIPGLNTSVFKHAPISWEWALVGPFTLVYVIGIEIWKCVKRYWSILDDHAVVKGAWSQGQDQGEGKRKLAYSMSFSSLKSWKSWGKTTTNGQNSSPV
ncbi:hypothetical protein QBC46DRAFT_351651 [Diplogelasinospora grovesii]|uniref:P-type Na(+) transporter n=1 Tax=Diplogelasinospora grovesii TaxID=303347 RepID=A0AAN6NCI5_9PEZI|nr:hypothetical protein QBC46DRAFT_351651 [Diplogelasinospora grovesii]